MGMYDEITVKHKLPNPKEIKSLFKWNEYRFQTKDLENCLIEYVIKNNSLFEKIVEREYIEYTEEEKKDRKKKKQFFPIFKDVIEKSSTLKKLEDFHGVINFYTYEKLNQDQDFWIDFKASFIYGKLDKIELIDFKKEESRSIRNKEWEKEMEAKQKHPWNCFKKYASRLGWRWFWQKVCRSLFFISNQLHNIRTFIIKHIL